MSRINKLIADRCPQGVEFMALGDICIIKTGPNINKQVIAERLGPYPVINSGRDPLGYVDHFNTENDPIGIASRGSVGLVTWTPGRFFRGNLNYSCTVRDSAQLDVRFLYHYLLHANAEIQALATHQGIPALNAGALKTLQIPVPPKKDQIEIVSILDAFTQLITELITELTTRKKQYKHYRDQLLSFQDEAVECKALGEVYKFQYGTGNTIPTLGGEYPVYGSNGIVGSHNEYNSEDSPVIGHIGAYAGIVNWGAGKHFVTYNGVICRLINKDVLPKYAYYQLLKQDFNSMAKSASHPFVSYDALNKVSIPIPSSDEQARIVAILDKFDALTNSLTEGLPREIELRQKQYEHYRDLLLSFPKSQEVMA